MKLGCSHFLLCVRHWVYKNEYCVVPVVGGVKTQCGMGGGEQIVTQWSVEGLVCERQAGRSDADSQELGGVSLKMPDV